MATARASVAMARLMPRTLVAGQPTSTPTRVATSAAARSAIGKGTLFSARRIEVKPATPANASWAREIWPVNPVSTTTDRARRANTIDTMRPWRSRWAPTVTSATDTRPTSATVHATTWRGCGEAAIRRARRSAARSGSASPRQMSTAMITAAGMICCSPVVGSQLGMICVSGRTDQPNTSDCAMPIARPAAVATPKDCRPPSNAAARAGMTSNEVVGVRPAMGSIRMIAAPARIDASAQLTLASRSGAMPDRSAPFSLLSAARVARPNRVKRNTRASAAAIRDHQRHEDQTVLGDRRAEHRHRVVR